MGSCHVKAGIKTHKHESYDRSMSTVNALGISPETADEEGMFHSV